MSGRSTELTRSWQPSRPRRVPRSVKMGRPLKLTPHQRAKEATKRREVGQAYAEDRYMVLYRLRHRFQIGLIYANSRLGIRYQYIFICCLLCELHMERLVEVYLPQGQGESIHRRHADYPKGSRGQNDCHLKRYQLRAHGCHSSFCGSQEKTAILEISEGHQHLPSEPV